jgi:hypothetical protein
MLCGMKRYSNKRQSKKDAGAGSSEIQAVLCMPSFEGASQQLLLAAEDISRLVSVLLYEAPDLGISLAGIFVRFRYHQHELKVG